MSKYFSKRDIQSIVKQANLQYNPPKITKEPKLEDYGLSEKLIIDDKEKSKKINKSKNILFLSVLIISFIIFAILNCKNINDFVIYSILWFLCGYPILFFIYVFLSIEKKSNIKILLEKYETDKSAWHYWQNKKKNDYWFSLSGHEFEYKLANLYKSLGYKAEVTKGSGDAGIDIILEKDGEKICVQCKAHKKPVGPAIVRELYGSMFSSGFNQGILVCLGGFTSGVYDFVLDKPIKLVDVDDILKMAN